jgi:cysteine desulfurase
MRLYLDHNATTPVDPRVLERFVAVERSCPGNPSSVHTAGRRARAVVEDARRSIAARLAVDHDAVLFTSGGTESNNLAVLGVGDPAHGVVASAAEHPSVIEAPRRRGRIELPVDAEGRARFTAEWLPPDRPIALVCAVFGQSEVGSLSDLAAARSLADALGAALHVDASQALGRVDLAPVAAAADTWTLALHKAGGLRGSGVLVVRTPALALRPLGAGGGQELGLRPGTVSPALAAAAATAVALALDEQEQRAAAMRAARDAFLSGLADSYAGTVQRLSPSRDVLPNTSMLAFPGVRDGRTLLPALDLAGVDASHGTACSSGSPQPAAVLLAMGLDEAAARRCVRFSFSHHTMIDAAQQAAGLVADALARATSS